VNKLGVHHPRKKRKERKKERKKARELACDGG